MNILLLSQMNERLKFGMQKLTLLPFNQQYTEQSTIQLKAFTATVVHTYLNFFKAVNFLQTGYNCYRGQTVISLKKNQSVANIKGLNRNVTDELCRLLHGLCNSVDDPLTIVPVHITYSNLAVHELKMVIGTCILNQQIPNVFLHELAINSLNVSFKTTQYRYLENILVQYNMDKDIKSLCTMHHKGYRQFQKDCKNCYGTTFYNFILKMKMLNIVEDFLFTDFTINEIVYKNKFVDYSHVHRLFHKRYQFPLNNIERLKYKM